MRPPLFIFISLITLAVFLAPNDAAAHGGGPKKETPKIEEPTMPEQAMPEQAAPEPVNETEEESSLEDSIYGSEGEDPVTDEGDELEGSSFLSDADLLSEDLSGMDSHEGMDMGDSAGHNMEKEIEIGAHKMVSRKSKGYGAAVGITVLAGLVFGFLTLKRPFE